MATERSAPKKIPSSNFLATHGARALPLFIFLFLSSIYLFTLQGIPLNGDPETMYLVSLGIATRGSVALSPNPDMPLQKGPDGAFYSKFGIGQSLVEAPFVKISRYFTTMDMDTIYIYYLGFLAAVSAVPLLSAGAALLLFYIVISLGYSRKSAAACSLVYGCASLAWPMSKFGFSEPLQTFLVLASFLAAIKVHSASSLKRLALCAAAGFFAGFLIATKSAMIIFSPIIFIFMLSKIAQNSNRTSRLRSFAGPAISFAFPLLFWLAVALAYNNIRFGSPLNFGYSTGHDGEFGFTTPLLSGLYGLLLSPGKSVFLYSPALIPAIAFARSFHKKHVSESLLIWTFTAASLLVYSKWWAWHGDDCWGPRFLLPCIPLALLPLSCFFETRASRRFSQRAAVALLFAVSLYVQIPGTLVNFNEYLKTVTKGVEFGIFFTPGQRQLRDSGLAVHFTPEFSPIAGHTWMLYNMLSGNAGDHSSISSNAAGYPWSDLTRYGSLRVAPSALPYDFWHEYLPSAGFFPQSRNWTCAVRNILAVSSVLSLIALFALLLAPDAPAYRENSGKNFKSY